MGHFLLPKNGEKISQRKAIHVSWHEVHATQSPIKSLSFDGGVKYFQPSNKLSFSTYTSSSCSSNSSSVSSSSGATVSFSFAYGKEFDWRGRFCLDSVARIFSRYFSSEITTAPTSIFLRLFIYFFFFLVPQVVF